MTNVTAGIDVGGIKGYKTDTDHTGQGIAGEAVAALVEYIFKDLKIRRIEACILPSNIPSVKVAESCGFIHIAGEERALQINGIEQTHLIYSLENPRSTEM